MPNVTRVEYRKDRKNLCVQYRERVWYTYEQVPETVANTIRKAPSRGKAIWDLVRIRGTKYGHRYTYYKAGGNECRDPFLGRAAGLLKGMVVGTVAATVGAVHAAGRGLAEGIKRAVKRLRGAKARLQQRQQARALSRAISELDRVGRRLIKARQKHILSRTRRRLVERHGLAGGLLRYIPRRAMVLFTRRVTPRIPYRFSGLFSRIYGDMPSIAFVEAFPNLRAGIYPAPLPDELRLPEIMPAEPAAAWQLFEPLPKAARVAMRPYTGLHKILQELRHAELPLENVVSVDPMSRSPSTVLLTFYALNRTVGLLDLLVFLRELPRWERAVVAQDASGVLKMVLQMAPLTRAPEFWPIVKRLLEGHANT